MKHSPLLLTPALLFLLLLEIHTTAMAQTNLSSCDLITKSNNFLALADKRAELLDETQDLKVEISDLEKQLPDAISVAELEEQKRLLTNLKEKATRTPLEEQTMQNLENKTKLLKTEDINGAVIKDDDNSLCRHGNPVTQTSRLSIKRV